MNQCVKEDMYKVGKLWQRNYFEHIIRNDNDLYEMRKYIKENPLRWKNEEIRKY